MQTRRAALLTIAGAAATPIFGQQVGQHEMHEEGAAVLSYEPKFFQPADYAVVTRLVDLILPRTDTPGAVDAHVPFRIDHQVLRSAALQSEFAAGLATLPRDFVSLTEAEQVAALRAMSGGGGAGQAFFELMKGLTVDWYYKSEEGLVAELGFHGNTYRSEFPGCTHPEHWPAEVKANG